MGRARRNRQSDPTKNTGCVVIVAITGLWIFAILTLVKVLFFM